MNEHMKKNKWIESEDDFLRKNYKLHGSLYCAVHLGRTGASVRSRCRLLGIKQKDMPRHYSEEEDNYIKRNFYRKTIFEISVAIGRTSSSVKQRAIKIGASGQDQKF